MTSKEIMSAIGNIEDILTVRDCTWLKTAKEALEKQLPKEPTFEGDGYDDSGNIIYDTWFCPCCGASYEVDYDDYEHCPKCGQSIDWHAYEEEYGR